MKNRFLKLTLAVLITFTLFLILTACNSQLPELKSPALTVTNPPSTGISGQTPQASAATDNPTSPFDTGAAPSAISSESNSWNLDYATIKYDSQGHQLWVARYNGPGNANDRAVAVAADDQGNTYVTGSSMGSHNGTSPDFATLKYDPSGQQLWLARYQGLGYGGSAASAMVLDKAGNIYVTGESSGIDNTGEYATIKYDTNGNQLWVARYSEPGDKSNQSSAIAIDDSGNIYVTGKSIAKYNIAHTSTVKYDNNGQQIWAARHSQDNGAWIIALDRSGDVYVTGYNFSLKYDSSGQELWEIPQGAHAVATDNANNVYLLGTAKYDSSGKQLWSAAYPQENFGNKYQSPTGLAADENGNVYVSGWSEGSRPSNNGGYLFDFTTIKYNSAGKQLWIAKYSEPANGENSAYALALDSSGDTYVTGSSGFLGDGSDYATVKYDNDGHQLWAARYHGPGNGSGVARAIAVDKEGNTYIAGESPGSGIARMTQSPYPNVPIYQNPDQTIQVKVGDEMAFGFDTFTPGGLTWNEEHDATMLSLLDEEGISFQPNYPSSQNTWFLCKALQPGETQITFTYSFGGGIPVNRQVVFKINVN